MALKEKFLLWLEIFGDLLAGIVKIIFGFASKSAGLIAEGFHSFADSGNQVFLLIGLKSSKKKADQSHPFGYGKEKFFWALLSALFIMLFSGGIAIYQGVLKLIKPEPITNYLTNISVLGIIFIFQIVIFIFSTRSFQLILNKSKKLEFIKSPSIINLWFSDLMALAGTIIVGIALTLSQVTNNSVFDAISSILIGIMLFSLGIFLASDAKELLIGEAVSPPIYKKIKEIFSKSKEVIKLRKLKTMHLTPNEILINADVEFKDELTTTDIEQAIDKIESKIKEEVPQAKQIYIEAES